MTSATTDLHVHGTRPYAWPWDGAVVARTLALLIVQAPDGPPPGRWQPTLTLLAAAVTAAGGTVIEVATSAPLTSRYDDRKPGSADGRGVEIFPDHRVHAAGWNGFYASPLDGLLRAGSITQLLMTGYWLEVGVHSTLRAANDRGYECLLVEDAVAPFDDELTASALSSIQMSGGIFGAVGDSAAVIAALSH